MASQHARTAASRPLLAAQLSSPDVRIVRSLSRVGDHRESVLRPKSMCS